MKFRSIAYVVYTSSVLFGPGIHTCVCASRDKEQMARHTVVWYNREGWHLGTHGRHAVRISYKDRADTLRTALSCVGVSSRLDQHVARQPYRMSRNTDMQPQQ